MLKRFLKYFCLMLILSMGLLMVLVTQPILPVPEKKPSPAVDPAVLKAHVKALSEDFHPRCYDHPENLETVARYIEGHFKAAGGRVSVQTFPVDELTYSNIIADFGPEDGPLLIVGAHYDSYGENYREQPLYTPGADDNASGVAGLLALAELLGKYPPAQHVQLVAYSLEEPPFFRTEQMGSAAHAAKIHKAGTLVLGVIILEMVGRFSDAPGSQTYPVKEMSRIYPDTGNFISIVGRFQDIFLTRTVKAAMRGASDLPVYSINALPAIPGIDFSDHRNYWPYGHEAVMITDTAFYRNFAYHTEQDTADMLDYTRMAKVVQGVFAAVRALSGEKNDD